MLRRPATALTLTNEDLTRYEEKLAAYKLHKQQSTSSSAQSTQRLQQPSTDSSTYMTATAAATDRNGQGQRAENKRKQKLTQTVGDGVDPNDEIKPFPGDRAGIVRRREERVRVMGGGGGGTGSVGRPG